MQITDIRIKLGKNPDSALKAIASITIENCFVVHDIKVLQGESELYIAMPSKKVPDNNLGKDVYKDIAHPINTETREELKKLVLGAYQEEINKPRD